MPPSSKKLWPHHLEQYVSHMQDEWRIWIDTNENKSELDIGYSVGDVNLGQFLGFNNKTNFACHQEFSCIWSLLWRFDCHVG